MRNRSLALFAGAAILAFGQFGTAFATPAGSTGPTGSGSSESETQGAAPVGSVPKAQHPAAGTPGPAGSGSSEAEVQGSAHAAKVNPHKKHNSAGVVTHGSSAVGSSGTH